MPQISVDTAMIGTYHDVYQQSFSGADMHQTAKIFMTGRSQAAGQDLSIPRRQIRELRDPFSNMKK